MEVLDVIMLERVEMTCISSVEQDHDQEHLAQGKLPITPTLPHRSDQMMSCPLIINLRKIINTAIQSGNIKTHGDDLYECYVRP